MRPPGIFTKQRKAVQNALAVRQVEMAAVVPADRLLPGYHVPDAAAVPTRSDTVKSGIRRGWVYR